MELNKANIELKSLLIEEMQKENISYREEDLDNIIFLLIRVISDAEVYDMLLDLDTESEDIEAL
ncbi:hypothetical protein PN290_00255 [Romboutsia sp. 1001216sp1]|uniref:hypothetical protein n=1 Tax=unclassified Romboutsia TaxID=2626894 RepID=UPI0018AB1304|nr:MULTISPECIES: hypothetical protein [unclassified Romboutsia]MDB8794285.1 hypothetical protein [Romboutsia sp. 1001216sp1]MDB8796454.1 hypothetical protein [Romboutsia sp. 1001216sp1]MDB8797793.1 hypothetical protein [Romboutsia sp. 1001216sp1]